MIKILLLSTVLLYLLPMIAFTQNKKTQNTPPSLVLSLEDAIKPGKVEEYIRATKEWLVQLKSDNVITTFNTFLETDDIINYLEPIPNLSAIDTSALKKSLASFQGTEPGQQRLSTIYWSKYSVWDRSSQLSYVPADPDTSPAAMPYFTWKHFQIRPDKESNFIDLAVKCKKIFQKHKIGRGYGVFCNIIGYQRPWYTVIFPGKDPGELYQWQKKMEQKLGPELKPLLKEIYEITQQITDGSGWTIKELSLTNK